MEECFSPALFIGLHPDVEQDFSRVRVLLGKYSEKREGKGLRGFTGSDSKHGPWVLS